MMGVEVTNPSPRNDAIMAVKTAKCNQNGDSPARVWVEVARILIRKGYSRSAADSGKLSLQAHADSDYGSAMSK